MFTTVKSGILIALMAVFSALPVAAQQSMDPLVAPRPAQLLSAKKVFVSNASGEAVTPQGVSELAYNEFYADLKSWGAYELVGTPADADLVLEMRYELIIQPSEVSRGNGGTSQFEQFRLIVRDPKTQTVLWAFTRVIPGANRQSTGRKNFDQTMAAIVGDLRELATTSSISAGTAAKK
jgi:hypothetical protein